MGSVIGSNSVPPLNFKFLLEYKIKYVLTLLILVSEIFCQNFAPCVAVALIAISIGLFGLPQFLGIVFSPWLHLIVLILVLFLFSFFLMRATRQFSLPSAIIIERRLELNSGLYHRPFSTISDGIINDHNSCSRLLWTIHRERAFNSLKYIKVGAPVPIFSFRDPYAFRAGIGILLAVALAVGWRDADDRLLAAIKPDFSRNSVNLVTKFHVWLNPPSYTRIAPILLNSKGKENSNQIIIMPEGSDVLANSMGNGLPLRLIVKNKEGTTTMTETLRQTNSDMFQAELKNVSGSNLSLCRKKNCLATWNLTMIPDGNPEIDFHQPPAVLAKGGLQLIYKAVDDYGVKKVSVRIGLDGDNIKKIDEQVQEIQVSDLITPKRKLVGRKFIDFGPHPWSGQAVWFELRVTDEIGQIGRSRRSKIKLPVRLFHNPVAREIIKERKLLISLPETRTRISKRLLNLAGMVHTYGHDWVTFLSLKAASARLLFNGEGSEDESVISLLWNTALRAEQGKSYLAEQRLMDVQRQLQNALSKEGSKEKIRHLIDQFETAVERYFSNLDKQMLRNKKTLSNQVRRDAKHKTVQRKQIRQMIKRLRDMSNSGMRTSATQMLARMSELFKQLTATSQRLPKVSEEILKRLGELGERQQQILDETFKKSKQKSSEEKNKNNLSNRLNRQTFADQPLSLMKRPLEGSYDSNSSMRLTDMQMKLHNDLGELLKDINNKFGSISKDFKNAKTFMRQAGSAIKGNQLDVAINLQNRVLTHIQQGGRFLIDQFESAGKQNQINMNDNLDQVNGNRPIGGNRRPQRSFEYFFNIGKEILPNDYKLQKARQIIEELRKRSSDKNRPLLERRYIDRLLERF